MVQMRVITKGNGISDLLRQLPDQVDQIKIDVLTQMATDIALDSPVYTGEYARNHQLALRSGSFSAHETRKTDTPVPLGQQDSIRQEAADRLAAQVKSINIKSENFVFRNPMFYASVVEGDYGVYAQARKKAAQAVQEAVQRARRRT